MARPRKCRRVCQLPVTRFFVPEEGLGEAGLEKNGGQSGFSASVKAEKVVLSVDEYETIRLIDLEGLSQEECSRYMDVARTTVQLIYMSARRKLARMLVLGLPLEIGGGDYQLCSGGETRCGCSDCYLQKLKQEYGKTKGEHSMRISVTYENGEIFQHFGHTEEFKVYDVENGAVVSSQVVSTNGSGHGALAGVLSALNAEVLICGGIGGGARMALDEAGIKLYGGVSGSADKAVEALLAGNLEFNPDVQCDHHGEHHHEGEACGEHGCGNHGCGEHH